MQIIRDILQGSEEWTQLRLGVATASNFNKIITATGKESATLEKYALQLATESTLFSAEPNFKNEIMARGNELEAEARQVYQEETFNIVEEITMFKSDCGNFGYSPDGLIANDGLIEIKCPLATTHFQYILDDKVPSDYWQQLQGGLWVSGRNWIDFFSYHPNFKEKKFFIKRVERDNNYIYQLEILVKKTILLKEKFLKQFKGE
jgi:putative phage-type endonuclease